MLLLYAKNYHSQNGEDGVIEKIFERIGVKDGGWTCEFGAGNGKTISNSYHWIEKHGFKAVYIECSDEYQQIMDGPVKDHPGQIFAFREKVTPENIDEILGRTEIPEDFDLLSIDIDSYDYAVWEGLTKYRPKVVIIEVNSSLLPGELHTYTGGPVEGNSFTSTVELGKKKGYTAVCHTGNLIFVRDEFASKVLVPDDFFVWNWVSDIYSRVKSDMCIILRNPLLFTS